MCVGEEGTCGAGRDAVGGKGPQRRPQRRLDRRLEEVAEAVEGGYCRLQMPLTLALGVRETVAGNRLGALEGERCPIHPWVRGRGMDTSFRNRMISGTMLTDVPAVDCSRR